MAEQESVFYDDIKTTAAPTRAPTTSWVQQVSFDGCDACINHYYEQPMSQSNPRIGCWMEQLNAGWCTDGLSPAAVSEVTPWVRGESQLLHAITYPPA